MVSAVPVSATTRLARASRLATCGSGPGPQRHVRTTDRLGPIGQLPARTTRDALPGFRTRRWRSSARKHPARAGGRASLPERAERIPRSHRWRQVVTTFETPSYQRGPARAPGEVTRGVASDAIGGGVPGPTPELSIHPSCRGRPCMSPRVLSILIKRRVTELIQAAATITAMMTRMASTARGAPSVPSVLFS